MKNDIYYQTDLVRLNSLTVVKRSRWIQVLDQPMIRRFIVLFILVILWHCYAIWLDNSLLMPTPLETWDALYLGLMKGSLGARILNSLGLLSLGYTTGIVVGGVLTILALMSRFGREFQSTLIAMFNPLPAIALLPLAMLWFGLGTASLVFVLAHSVMWTFGLNILAGFDAVSKTLRMVGRNYDLKGLRLVWYILVPAAFPSILTGLRVSWAFAWRTLIAAELVFGVSAGSGGLGWYIYENKNQLETASVFAGLFAVIFIGLVIEHLIFRVIENKTVRVWGMLS